MPGRVASLPDIFTYGWLLRVWCYRCARATVLDIDQVLPTFERNRWPIDIEAARNRFRCTGCGHSDQILLVPASRPPEPEEISWERQVYRWFHDSRAAAKSAHRKQDRQQNWRW